MGHNAGQPGRHPADVERVNDERKAWQAMSMRARAARLGPLLGAFVVAFAATAVSRGELVHPWLMVLAAVLTAATAASMLGSVWSRSTPTITLVPVVMVCVVVHLMRASTGLGSTSGYGSLLLIPVVWQAMRRRHLELWLTVAVVSLTNVASVFWLPSPATTSAQWRSVVLFTIIAATIGQTINRLVAERLGLMAQVAELATRDTVTGLFNRRAWDERLPALVATAARSGAPLTLAIIDLDQFKAYNDTLGHQSGDALLRAAADAWTSLLRPADLLVRWG